MVAVTKAITSAANSRRLQTTIGTGNAIGPSRRTARRERQLSLRPPTDPSVSDRMRRVGRRGTPAELALQSELRDLPCRYVVDSAPLPGERRRADLVFVRERVAVFVDGCFWHGCPRHVSRPRRNAAWWRAKIASNAARDRSTTRLLRRSGWSVVRAWAHEDAGHAAGRVRRALLRRGAGLEVASRPRGAKVIST